MDFFINFSQLSYPSVYKLVLQNAQVFLRMEAFLFAVYNTSTYFIVQIFLSRIFARDVFR